MKAKVEKILTWAVVISGSALGIAWLAYGFIDDTPTSTTKSSLESYDDYQEERSYSDYGDYDCSDFSSQDDAQAFYEDQGGPEFDYHNLDRDHDGSACESSF